MYHDSTAKLNLDSLDAGRLPFRDGTVAAVTAVWLLHLLPAEVVARAVGESARVLRPGGLLVTTVDKNGRPGGPDASARIASLAAGAGLTAAGETTFVGLGQPALPGRRLDDPVYRVRAFRA